MAAGGDHVGDYVGCHVDYAWFVGDAQGTLFTSNERGARSESSVRPIASRCQSSRRRATQQASQKGDYDGTEHVSRAQPPPSA